MFTACVQMAKLAPVKSHRRVITQEPVLPTSHGWHEVWDARFV